MHSVQLGAARRAALRGLGSLGVLAASLLVLATAAGATGFSATLIPSQDSFSSSRLQLEATVGTVDCYSTAAEIGSAGQQLWVDGTEVGSNSSVTSAQSFTGYWHIGWGNDEATWSDAPTSSFLSGSLSQVAIIPSQLSSAQISTLYNAGSAAAFMLDMGQLSPTSYWPLQDSASNICGTTEITVQQTVGATNTCIYPSAAGTCAAPSSTYLVTGLGVRSITAPTAGTPVSVTVTVKLSAASPTGVLGLHELAGIAFGTAKPSTLWSAQIAYPYAWSQL